MEEKYKAKLFYEKKQKEHIEKFGVPFDTSDKIGEIIQEYADQHLKENNILYAFRYCDCIFESSHATKSLHRTRKGAEIALEFHKNEKRKEYEEVYPTEEDREEFPFGTHEDWDIEEIKIED